MGKHGSQEALDRQILSVSLRFVLNIFSIRNCRLRTVFVSFASLQIASVFFHLLNLRIAAVFFIILRDIFVLILFLRRSNLFCFVVDNCCVGC